MTDRYIEAPNISSGWIETANLLIDLPGTAAVHLVTRIGDPTTECANVRQLVNGLLSELGKQPVETVRNTLFPAAMAARFPRPEALAAHYRKRYPTIRRFASPRHETYFGRMVELRMPGGETINQLDNLTQKLQTARETAKARYSSRYEINIAMASVDVNLYSTLQDRTKTMGFPCLSLCSFHIADERLHLTAHYRNQYLIERGYGNYLGLGQLLTYIANATGFAVGELLVVAGHVVIDTGGKSRLRRILDEAR